MQIFEEGAASTLPALLLLHSRSQYLGAQLEVLYRSNIKRVYISIDGPRNANELKNQENIIQILRAYEKRFEVIEVRRNKVNLGLGLGIVTGIDWFFENSDKGMIFEDDVIFEQDCVEFFRSGTEFLTRNREILLLGGSNPFAELSTKNNVVLTNYPQIWGWASTKDNWILMRSYITIEPEVLAQLPRAIREFWKTGWRRVTDGYVDTWDTPIAAGFRLSGALCALPPVNLTSNRGVDRFAVNTKRLEFPLRMPISRLNSRLTFDKEDAIKSVEIINRKFEEEIYKVSFRHNLSKLGQIFDRLRFGQPNKPLHVRLQEHG